MTATAASTIRGHRTRQAVRPVRIQNAHGVRWHLIWTGLSGRSLRSTHSWSTKARALEEAGFARAGLSIGGWETIEGREIQLGVRCQTQSKSQAYRSASQAIWEYAWFAYVVKSVEYGEAWYTVYTA